MLVPPMQMLFLVLRITSSMTKMKQKEKICMACRVLFTCFFLICSSCTSMLMDSGKRPGEMTGKARVIVDAEYGKPIVFGHEKTFADQAEIQKVKKPNLPPFEWYGIYNIHGPFPEPDVTKSLEALYASVFTLGLAEIVMFPPTLISKIQQRSEKRQFVFLFNTEEIAIFIFEVSQNLKHISDPQIRIEQ